MPDAKALSPARRRRRARRRRAAVITVVAVVVLGGGGTAWALSGSNGPSYRLASVERADVSQTVGADGTLSANDQATLDFAMAGTVSAVRVAVGDRVTAGEVVATIDPSTLDAAVTAAKATLSRAKQTLSSDETAQADGTASTTSSTSGTGTGTGGTSTSSAATTATDSAAVTKHSTGTVVLMAAVTSTITPAQMKADQQAVVTAQQTLDNAVDDLTSACTTTGDTETTQTVAAGADGAVSGTVGDDATVVTIAAEGTTSENPQTVAAGGGYSFAGLNAGTSYKVVLVPVVDDGPCTSAISAVSAAKGSTGRATKGSLYYAIDTLNADIAKLEAASSSGSGTSTGSGSGPGAGTGTATGTGSKPGAPSGSTGSSSGTSGTGSSTGATTGTSGRSTGTTPTATSSTAMSPTAMSPTATSSTAASSSSTSSGTLVTAEQIAADSKAIDAAMAAVAVARNNLGFATLTSPMSGTVGAVALAKGDSVSASSTSDTVTVVGNGTLSVAVSVSLADIDLIKVGEAAAVSVDGRSTALPAKVTLVGLMNTSGSTGSSAAYTVTVNLDTTNSALYDGMGGSVAIAVGTADQVLSVPISALHTTGTQHTVDVYANGKVSATRVTTGVEGDDRVQIDSGLTAGQQIVLADIGAAIPSSTDTTTSTGRSSLTSGLSGTTTGGLGSGGGGFGGPPGN